MKHGKGVYTLSDGSYYEGDFEENKMSGEGVFKYQDDKSYEGGWKDNKMHGHGVYRWPDILFSSKSPS